MREKKQAMPPPDAAKGKTFPPFSQGTAIKTAVPLPFSAPSPRMRRFVKNLSLLTLTTLVMRGVGVAFGSYLTRLIGADGMGLYALINSVYAFAVTFAASGINLAVTRNIAAALGRKSPAEAKKTLAAGICYALFFGLLATALLFFGADFMGTQWLGDGRTVSSLKLLAVTLCPIALGSVFGGYFTATRHVSKNALVAAAEQAVKIALTLYLVTRFADRGLEFACLAMVGGSCIAEGASLVLYSFLCLSDRRRHLSGPGCAGLPAPGRRVVGVALPVAVTAWARTGLVTLEHILIPKGLRQSGASATAALATYGTIHGMVFPVIFFPTAFLGTFAGLMVPELAEYCATGDHRAIDRVCGRVIGVTLFFAIGCAGILCFLAQPIGMALYGSPDAARYIRIFAALIPMMYLDTMVDSILKGLGAQITVMVINLFDALGCVLAVWLLVPIYGIAAYVWIVFISEILNLALSAVKLGTITHITLHPIRWVLLPLAAVVGAACCQNLILTTLHFSFYLPVFSIIFHSAGTAFWFFLFSFCLSGGKMATHFSGPARVFGLFQNKHKKIGSSS